MGLSLQVKASQTNKNLQLGKPDSCILHVKIILVNKNEYKDETKPCLPSSLNFVWNSKEQAYLETELSPKGFWMKMWYATRVISYTHMP